MKSSDFIVRGSHRFYPPVMQKKSPLKLALMIGEIANINILLDYGQKKMIISGRWKSKHNPQTAVLLKNLICINRTCKIIVQFCWR